MDGDKMFSLAIEAVINERLRQDVKWGEQNHDPITYLAILAEEVGELAQTALQDRFGTAAPAHMRLEAVQVAAVALAIVECLDRAKWRWPSEFAVPALTAIQDIPITNLQ